MSNITNTLKEASEGLRWMSESDYPFEVFCWEGNDLTTETILQMILQKTGHPSDAPVEVVAPDKFFGHATEEKDWHNEEERAEVKQYQTLVETLKTHLSDIQVYRVGRVEVDVCIVGRTASGNLAGLSTTEVKT